MGRKKIPNWKYETNKNKKKVKKESKIKFDPKEVGDRFFTEERKSLEKKGRP